jgi:hypothetical protein
VTVVNYTPEQWQAAFERADDRALEWEERCTAAENRVRHLEAALEQVHHWAASAGYTRIANDVGTNLGFTGKYRYIEPLAPKGQQHD